MLAEIAVYLTSVPSTPSRFRSHLAGAVGLWSRGRRQRQAWAPHLERTRHTISDVIATLPRRRTVAILGSGPLFDVPLEALAAAFEHVLLVDIAHLSPSGRRVASSRNVTRLWRDLAPAGDPKPLAFLGDIAGLDWVISVNLLSQLGHGAPEGEETATVAWHLDGLSALPVHVTLVTDTDYRCLDRTGREVERFDLLHGNRLPRPGALWDWEVAPFGEESREIRRIHSVAAYPDWQRARGLVRNGASSRFRAADPVAQQDRARDS